MQVVFEWVLNAVKELWNKSTTIYILAFALMLRILDAYVVPQIRKLMGKD